MQKAKVQITPWEGIEEYEYDNLDLKIGDKVIVKKGNLSDLGEVVSFCDPANDEKLENNGGDKEQHKEEKGNREDGDEKGTVIRIATAHDAEKLVSDEEKKEALEYCRQTKDKHGLVMKFIDSHFSFDGSRITFAFIADGRVDFRELVKDLTRHFGRTIRLQQIGIRDEAKVMGDYGHCGRELCCKRFLKDLTSITSEMAEFQQCSHRGSERISGVCGRLMCCLAYEEKGYENLAKNLMPIGTKIKVDGKRGIVVGHNILKQTVNVELSSENGSEEGTIVEMGLDKKIIK